MNTKQIVLAERPTGAPALDNFRFENTELPVLRDGEVLLKGWYYSVDPYMRGRMNDAKSYVPPFQVGQPIVGGVVATVSESKSDNFKAGDIVAGSFPWREQFIAPAKGLRKIDTTIAPASYYLSVLGMTGLAAYFGLIHIGKPKLKETVVISGAAGAVGLVVGQIAKIHGCNVVGIAGSDEKATLLKEKFGFDEVVNYKTSTDIRKDIAKVCANGVDVYFDNVGGDISDAVIGNINFHGRIALCGQISLYNSAEITMGPRLQPVLLTKSALMQGFIVGDYTSQFPEGTQHLTQWVKEKKLLFTETIVHGFDRLPAAFLALFNGANTGKMIVEA